MMAAWGPRIEDSDTENLDKTAFVVVEDSDLEDNNKSNVSILELKEKLHFFYIR